MASYHRKSERRNWRYESDKGRYVNPIAGLVPDPEPERETGMLDLPESCILVIFSLTMPCDIGRLSVVSNLFNSVAYSGDLWNKSLLKICHQIVSRADPPCPSFNGKTVRSPRRSNSHRWGHKDGLAGRIPSEIGLHVTPGNWFHAGYHLTTSIAAPALLSLPFAFAALGWFAGILCLIVGAAVTFYSYNLLYLVLERLESEGNRHLRFRDLARDILGPKWARLTVAPIQFAVCLGTVIGSTLLGGQSLKFIYLIYHPNGAMKLYEFIIIFGIVMLFLAQMPSFHSLRHLNLISLILCLLYSICVVGGSIHAEKDYSFTRSSVSKVFGAFNSVAIIATTYGNGIIPEIQKVEGSTYFTPLGGRPRLCTGYNFQNWRWLFSSITLY